MMRGARPQRRWKTGDELRGSIRILVAGGAGAVRNGVPDRLALESRPALYWGCGYLAAALGFSAQFLTGIVAVEVQALTADILFLGAFFFYGQAVLVHFGKPAHLAHRLGAILLGFCVLAYVVIVEKNLQAELLVSDLTCAYLLAIPLICVRGSSRHGVETLLIAVASLVVAEMLIGMPFSYSWAAPAGWRHSFRRPTPSP